jgi:hypothetical protein
MLSSTVFLLALVLGALPSGARGATRAHAARETPAEVPEDGRKQVAEQISALRAAVAAYLKDKRPIPGFDNVMKGIVDLGTSARISGPKDRTAIARALADAVTDLLPTMRPGTLGAGALGVAVTGVGSCGAAGVPMLIALLNQKDVEKFGDVLVGIHRALGMSGTEAGFETLLRAARKREIRSLLLAAAGFEASSSFDATQRKKAFEALLAGAKSIRAQAGKPNPGDVEALNRMLAAVGKALPVLARADARELDDWETWAKAHAKDGWADAKPADAPEQPVK